MTRTLSDDDLATVLRALDDAAYYRLGTEVANAEELEDEDDRELFYAYRELAAQLEAANKED